MSDNLHSAIMNMQCQEPDLKRTCVAPAYRLGHRDARHAAAGLAASHADRIAALSARVVELEAMAWIDRIAALTAERDALAEQVKRARDGLECAKAIMDTPIARRRLGLKADDERLMVFRAAMKGGDA